MKKVHVFQKVHGVVEQPIEPRETRAQDMKPGKPKNNILKIEATNKPVKTSFETREPKNNHQNGNRGKQNQWTEKTEGTDGIMITKFYTTELILWIYKYSQFKN